MAKTHEISKIDLANMVVEYGIENDKKKALVSLCKDMADEIKEGMDDWGILSIEGMGYTATISFRENKKLDVAAVEKLLGRPIPAECYKITQTPVLNVAPNGKAAAKKSSKAA